MLLTMVGSRVARPWFGRMMIPARSVFATSIIVLL